MILSAVEYSDVAWKRKMHKYSLLTQREIIIKIYIMKLLSFSAKNDQEVTTAKFLLAIINFLCFS